MVAFARSAMNRGRGIGPLGRGQDRGPLGVEVGGEGVAEQRGGQEQVRPLVPSGR